MNHIGTGFLTEASENFINFPTGLCKLVWLVCLMIFGEPTLLLASVHLHSGLSRGVAPEYYIHVSALSLADNTYIIYITN